MLPLAQMAAPQLPPLPEGPSLENVRGPIDATGLSALQIVLAAIATLLILGGLLWLYFRTRKHTQIPSDPKSDALAELEAASATEDDERFAQLCANSVRRLLQACYDLPATSQTTSELADRLPAPEESKNQIRSFLSTCDGVKFAKLPLEASQRIQLADTARELIESHGRKEPSQA